VLGREDDVGGVAGCDEFLAGEAVVEELARLMLARSPEGFGGGGFG
jgi:hypothetical protein